jgi:hypothetical protein
MSLSRRLAAAAALVMLAMSVFAVPACEVDSSTGPRGSRPDVVQRVTPPVTPSGTPAGAPDAHVS